MEDELNKAKSKLQECQLEKNYKSCNECSELFECEIRRQYVNAVYKELSDGGNGNFNF